MKQAINRTAGNTLLLRIASNLYIKMAAPGWPFSCNTGIKIHCRRACQTEKPGLPVLCDQALNVICIVTQFARESFAICRFVVCV